MVCCTTVLYGTGTSRLQQVHSVRVETFLIYFSLPFLQLSSMIHTYSIHTCNIMNIGFTIIINNRIRIQSPQSFDIIIIDNKSTSTAMRLQVGNRSSISVHRLFSERGRGILKRSISNFPSPLVSYSFSRKRVVSPASCCYFHNRYYTISAIDDPPNSKSADVSSNAPTMATPPPSHSIAEDVSSTESCQGAETQAEMDVLLEKAYKQARLISLLALQRKSPQSKEDKTRQGNNDAEVTNYAEKSKDNFNDGAATDSNVSDSSAATALFDEIVASKNKSHSEQQQQSIQILEKETNNDYESQFVINPKRFDERNKSHHQQQHHHQHQHQTTKNNTSIDTVNVDMMNMYDLDSFLNIQYETCAAEALLKLTSASNFQHAFHQKQQEIINLPSSFSASSTNSVDTDEKNVILSVHHTFLDVIQWLCNTLSYNNSVKTHNHQQFISSSYDHDIESTQIPPPLSPSTSLLPSRESIILSHILSLTERSHTLNLPLTLPMYELICTLIAKHGHHHSTNISLLLLDFSSSAKDALSPPQPPLSTTTNIIESESESTKTSVYQIIQPHFFSNTLKELLERNLIRDIIHLFHGMRNLHNIDHADLETGIALLAVLKVKADEHMEEGRILWDASNKKEKMKSHYDESNSYPLHHRYGDTNHTKASFDEDDAMELAMILQTPIMEELQLKQKELVQIDDVFGAMFDDNNSDDTENDNDWDDDKTQYDVNDDTIDNFLGDDFDEDDDKGREAFRQNTDDVNTFVASNSDHEQDENTKEEMEQLKILVEKMKTSDDESLKKSARSMATSIIENMNKKHTSSSKSSSSKNMDKKESIDSYDLLKHDDQHLLRELLYVRDVNWEIPDLVTQLEKWNANTGLSFSENYESELMKEITNENLDDDDSFVL